MFKMEGIGGVVKELENWGQGFCFNGRYLKDDESIPVEKI